jgi:hypothetical protein
VYRIDESKWWNVSESWRGGHRREEPDRGRHNQRQRTFKDKGEKGQDPMIVRNGVPAWWRGCDERAVEGEEEEDDGGRRRTSKRGLFLARTH